ncbi:MAG: stage III sporulation protein AD [Defluviitaleaceae bacterium]|nr:stage III sporulation protein AD [Defluviitaleaceae bacterium]
MDIMQIVAVGIISGVLSLTIKKQVPEIALLISIAAAVLIFFMVLPKISAIFGVLDGISARIRGDLGFIGTLIQITGIAYIAEFGAQICKDAGEGAIAAKIELAGKVLIMAASTPIIVALLNMITQVLV